MGEFDVFISYASEDRAAIADPLASALVARGVRVWYDGFSLKWGDSISESLGRGLAESRFGIVVLSPRFLAKNWPRHELRGLWSRELMGHKVILPLWHEVTHEQVLAFDPALADKKSLDTRHATLDRIADSVVEIVRGVPIARAATAVAAAPAPSAAWPRGLRAYHRESFDYEVQDHPDLPWVIGSSGCWLGAMTDGTYLLQNRTGAGEIQYGYVEIADPAVRAVAVSVRVRLSLAAPGARIGLLVRFDPASATYLAVALDRRGGVALVERTAAGWSEVVTFDPPPAYSAGWHKLGVLPAGDALDLYVDDARLDRVEPRAMPGRATGLIAVGIGDFEFDDFATYAL